MTKPRNALVEMGHQLARVTPPDVRELLAGDLAYTSTEFSPGGPQGHRRRRRGRILHRRLGGALFVPAGLATLVVDKLRQAGVQVAVRDCRRFGPRTTPCPKARVADWWEWEMQVFLDAVAREPRGLIEARGAADVMDKAALVCRMFPQANVLVAMNASRKRLRSLRAGLQTAAEYPFHLVEDYPWPYEGGRLVCSLMHFNWHNGVDFDVVIFPDALQVLSPGHVEAMCRLDHQRVYGFTPADMPIDATTLLRLCATIGPPLYGVPDPRGTEAPVSVCWCNPPRSPAPGRVAALERKRRGYWYNDRRNDFLAAVARGFAAGDIMGLRECGLWVAPTAAQAAGFPPAFTLLVESTEHGRELLRRLPGWKMIDAVPGKKAIPNSWIVRPLDRTVLTHAAAARMESIDADVLIYAGGEWPLAPGGFPPRGRAASSEVVLIDLADDFDEAAREAARRRRHDYAARGWAVVGAPAWMDRAGDGGICSSTGRQWKGGATPEN